ncbi:MAG: beta-lactamase family protein [Actinomycetia bacterium]|nr:beta-lactamase family protein [Actinomycetes bacterium]
MVDVHGTVEPGFEKVRDAFASNFDELGEVGAGFALHVHGELVVDIWAGVADKASGTLWSDDTLQLVFSTTKGIAAICVGMLADRGVIDLDTPMAEYWPEFGAAGKEALTVRQVMSHQCGLPAVDAKLSRADVLAVTPIVEALAAQAPLWEPLSAHGYHALTYGWLVGELIARADGRRINQFLQEEVAGPLGLEAWIGLPESEEYRASALLDSPPPATEEEMALMMQVMGPGTMGFRALTLDGAMMDPGGVAPVWNTRATHASELPAANGMTNARSLSAIYAATLAAVNGTRLLSAETMADMAAEQVSGPDKCLVAETRFGTGFMLKCDLVPLLNEGAFGHAGAGGSLGYADPTTGVGYGYLMNQMGGGIAGDPRTIALNEAVRACV